jgi:hypothetical protein
MLDRLPPDVLAHILFYAYRPVPWPWSDFARVNLACRAVCQPRRTRGWYLAHSSLIRDRVPVVDV